MGGASLVWSWSQNTEAVALVVSNHSTTLLSSPLLSIFSSCARLPSGAEYMFSGRDDTDASQWVTAIKCAIQDGRSFALLCSVLRGCVLSFGGINFNFTI